jgi:hypothetical protein
MCAATCQLEAQARNGALPMPRAIQASGTRRACVHRVLQRSTETTVFDWHPVLDAWMNACKKSRGTERHEPPGKSSFNAKGEKP